MEATERGNKALALGITIGIHALLFLLFIMAIFKTPIPPFPETPMPEVVFDFGNFIEGSGSTEANGMGDAQPSDANTAKTEKSNTSPSDNKLLTSNVEESVNVKSSEKTEKPNNTKVENTTEKTTEQKPSTELEAALNKLRNKKSGTGGDGGSDQPGNKGDLRGDPDGFEDGKIPNRIMTRRPHLVDDSSEEGKVVVTIVVNKAGKVIDAVPGARGSTTTNSVLYAKARQAALSTKYNDTSEGPEEVRTTISFTFVNN